MFCVQPRLGVHDGRRILILEDIDGDGVADKADFKRMIDKHLA